MLQRSETIVSTSVLKLFFSFPSSKFLVPELWAVRNNAGLYKRKTLYEEMERKMEENINKRSILLTFFKANLTKSKLFWKMKVFIMPVAHLWVTVIGLIQRLLVLPGKPSFTCPIGWEASLALNHWQRIWWSQFHSCMRFCWHEDFSVLANTEGAFILLDKHQTTSASF